MAFTGTSTEYRANLSHTMAMDGYKFYSTVSVKFNT